jgi:hypothetical protein
MEKFWKHTSIKKSLHQEKISPSLKSLIFNMLNPDLKTSLSDILGSDWINIPIENLIDELRDFEKRKNGVKDSLAKFLIKRKIIKKKASETKKGPATYLLQREFKFRAEVISKRENILFYLTLVSYS